MGTAVPAALLSGPLRRRIDMDSAGEDVGSGGEHELVGLGAVSSAERGQARGAGLHRADSVRSWSGAGAWSWQNPSFRCLRFFFFSSLGFGSRVIN